MKTAQTN